MNIQIIFKFLDIAIRVAFTGASTLIILFAGFFLGLMSTDSPKSTGISFLLFIIGSVIISGIIIIISFAPFFIKKKNKKMKTIISVISFLFVYLSILILTSKNPFFFIEGVSEVFNTFG